MRQTTVAAVLVALLGSNGFWQCAQGRAAQEQATGCGEAYVALANALAEAHR